jgi:hypothetical protein
MGIQTLSSLERFPLGVIAGLDPAIHLFRKKMDARVKPAHDGVREDTRLCFLLKRDLSRGPCA